MIGVQNVKRVANLPYYVNFITYYIKKDRKIYE